MKRSTLILGILALVLAVFAHVVWKSRASFMVWQITYIGVHLARAIHQPDYDSLASARVFDCLVVLINGLIYFAVLKAVCGLIGLLRRKRKPHS